MARRVACGGWFGDMTGWTVEATGAGPIQSALSDAARRRV